MIKSIIHNPTDSDRSYAWPNKKNTWVGANSSTTVDFDVYTASLDDKHNPKNPPCQRLLSDIAEGVVRIEYEIEDGVCSSAAEPGTVKEEAKPAKQPKPKDEKSNALDNSDEEVDEPADATKDVEAVNMLDTIEEAAKVTEKEEAPMQDETPESAKDIPIVDGDAIPEHIDLASVADTNMEKLDGSDEFGIKEESLKDRRVASEALFDFEDAGDVVAQHKKSKESPISIESLFEADRTVRAQDEAKSQSIAQQLADGDQQ
jgi:hypothetical protein